MKSALVSGITGQDGNFLAELLLKRGYRVVGLTLRAGESARQSLSPALATEVELVTWSAETDRPFSELLEAYRPDEIYNLAAISSGRGMFDDAVKIGEVNGIAVARVLDAIRTVDPSVRFCQASSSEIFAGTDQSPQSEETQLCPRSPYGAAKAFADFLVRIYRQRYGLFACSAILYNHESPRRSLDFVTRKIARGVAQIHLGRAKELRLGDLGSKRDWGFAGDYVRAMHLMLQADTPRDYVICTGRVRTVRNFCEVAFSHVGLDYRQFVVEDSTEFRRSELVTLVGDNSRARNELGWVPEVSFESLVAMMVDAEVSAFGSI